MLSPRFVVSCKTAEGGYGFTELNSWELMPSLHVLTGLHSSIPDKKNWIWTKLWSLMMDLTAIGLLIIKVISI
jgi:hypothetical protein